LADLAVEGSALIISLGVLALIGALLKER